MFLQSVSCITHFCFQLCLGLVVHNRQRDPTLTEKMMEMFAHFTGNLTDVAMSKVCQVFMYMSYHSPQVYRDITHFILGNHHNIEQLRILDAVKMFAQVASQFLIYSSLFVFVFDYCKKFLSTLQALTLHWSIFYIPENRLNFHTSKGFRRKISMKLVHQHMPIFFNFSPTSSHLHPLQVKNCSSNS